MLILYIYAISIIKTSKFFIDRVLSLSTVSTVGCCYSYIKTTTPVINIEQ